MSQAKNVFNKGQTQGHVYLHYINVQVVEVFFRYRLDYDTRF